MSALTDRPLSELERRNMPGLTAAAGVKVDQLPEPAARALRFLSGWDESTTAGIAALFSEIRSAALRSPRPASAVSAQGSAGLPNACPHCGATDAVPLASGLGCTNPWHEGSPQLGIGHVCQPNVCCGCGQEHHVGDVASLTIDEEDHGFQSKACLTAYVRTRFTGEVVD